MGFLSGLGKVLKGEPVFDPNQQPADGTQPAPAPIAGMSQVVPQMQKVIPVVMIGRIECPVNGQNMDVYGDIHNGSSVPVMLDRVSLLGAVHQLDTTLKPGESRQFLLYRGATLRSQPSGYAEVQYRTEAGDYFSARHTIRVHQGPEGFIVHELELTMPIHDMH